MEPKNKFKVIETPKDGNVIKHPTARNYVVEAMEESLKVVKQQIKDGSKPEVYFSIVLYENGYIGCNRGVDGVGSAAQWWALTHGKNILKKRIFKEAEEE